MSGMSRSEVRTIGQGATITFAGGLFGSALTYLTGVVVSRTVGAELLGVYFLSLVWVNLGSTLARFGLPDGLLRFLPPARLRGESDAVKRMIKTTLRIGASLGAALAGILFLLLVVLRAFPVDAALRSYLGWFVWVLPLHVVFILLLISIQAHQRMGSVTLIRDLLQPLLLLGLTVGLTGAFGPKVGLVGGFGLSFLFCIPAAAFVVGRIAPGSLTASGWAPLRPLLLFSVPVMASDVTSYLYKWLDSIIIERFLTLADVGVYNAASRTALLVSLVLLGANAIYASVASGYFNTSRPEKLEKALELSLRWCLLLALPIVLVFLLGGDWILMLWGSDFAAAGPSLRWLTLAHLLGIPAGLFAYTLLMCNRPMLEVTNVVGTLLLLVLLDVLLIPRLGMSGAAVALVGANLAGFVARAVEVRLLVGVRPLAPSLLKPLAAAVAAFLLASRLRPSLLVLWGGAAGHPAGPGPLLGLLASLAVAVAILFFGPYLLLDGQGRELIRASVLELPRRGRYAPQRPS